MFIIKSRAGGKCLFSSLPLEFASVIWGLEVGPVQKSSSKLGPRMPALYSASSGIWGLAEHTAEQDAKVLCVLRSPAD